MGLRAAKVGNGSDGDGSDPISGDRSNEEEKLSLENRFPISNDDQLLGNAEIYSGDLNALGIDS
jgi:hypothetical protein